MGLRRKRRSHKSGLAPGALVHIGEVKSENTLLTLTCIGKNSFSEHTLTQFSEIDDIPIPEDGVRWLNVYGLQDAALMGEIGQRFGLHPLVVEDILNTDQRPKVDDFEEYLFIVGKVYDSTRKKGDFAQDQISLIVGRDFVLTFQERRSGTFDPIRQRLRNASSQPQVPRYTSDYLAYSMLDAMVDSYFVITERLADKCEALEDEILGKPKRNALTKAHELKRELSLLRRTIWPTREMIGFLQRSHSGFLSEETRLHLRDVLDHSNHLLEHMEDLRELLTGLLDIYLNSVSNRVNLEVRTLTMLTTVFMPATLIAGIFGMNFKVMPWLEHPDGFWAVIKIMGGIAVLFFAVIWSRHLLR